MRRIPERLRGKQAASWQRRLRTVFRLRIAVWNAPQVATLAFDSKPRPVQALEKLVNFQVGSVDPVIHKEDFMLVLSRQSDETIIIGDNIRITIVEVRGDKVRIGIDAPRDVAVHRQEIYDAIRRDAENAARTV